MAKPKQHILLCACLLGTLLWTCDAPRNNPLDPLNPNVEWANLAGTARSSTSDILSDVLVRWHDNQMTTTDNKGYFLFKKIRPIDGMLYFSKPGYIEDSSYVEWDGRTTITHNISLHKNPTLTGRVETESYPRTRIDSVKVTWHPGQQFVYTDESGMFTFEQSVQSDGMLTFEKQGFRSEQVFVDWPPTEYMQIALNANPHLIDFSLYSSVENYYEPRLPTYEMVARARLEDAEGDIASVFIECPDLAIKKDLRYNVLDRVFERSFSKGDLGLADEVEMQEIVGYDFDLVVVDDAGDAFTLTQDRVVRVIEKVIEIESPNNGEDMKKQFMLKWKNPFPGFKHTYHAKIFTDDDFTPELVWQQDNIHAEAESLAVELDTETAYAWEIWIVDEFNNRARSQPVSFNVKE